MLRLEDLLVQGFLKETMLHISRSHQSLQRAEGAASPATKSKKCINSWLLVAQNSWQISNARSMLIQEASRMSQLRMMLTASIQLSDCSISQQKEHLSCIDQSRKEQGLVKSWTTPMHITRISATDS